jgi:glucose/arabinose dehydrogenase
MILIRAVTISVALFGALLVTAIAAEVVGHNVRPERRDATTFLIESGAAHFGRMAGLAVAKDGVLLVSDDTNGVIYRVAYSAPPR